MLSQWLVTVRVKHEHAMNMVADPKGQQPGLPVNQTPAVKVMGVDKGIGRTSRQGEELEQRSMGVKSRVSPGSYK